VRKLACVFEGGGKLPHPRSSVLGCTLLLSHLYQSARTILFAFVAPVAEFKLEPVWFAGFTGLITA